jgi:hypothetical protein
MSRLGAKQRRNLIANNNRLDINEKNGRLLILTNERFLKGSTYSHPIQLVGISWRINQVKVII